MAIGMNAADERNARATELAAAIERELHERTKDKITLEPVHPGSNAFNILWKGKSAGRLHIWIPRSEYTEQRTRYALTPLRGKPRTYVKLATLINRMIEVCRPPSAAEAVTEQKRSELEEVNRKIEKIEGETGAISRYLHIHRFALAAWLARRDPDCPDVPIELAALIRRMKDLVAQSAELRDKRVELEEQ